MENDRASPGCAVKPDGPAGLSDRLSGRPVPLAARQPARAHNDLGTRIVRAPGALASCVGVEVRGVGVGRRADTLRTLAASKGQEVRPRVRVSDPACAERTDDVRGPTALFRHPRRLFRCAYWASRRVRLERPSFRSFRSSRGRDLLQGCSSQHSTVDSLSAPSSALYAVGAVPRAPLLGARCARVLARVRSWPRS